jgi:hypothetical protein
LLLRSPALLCGIAPGEAALLVELGQRQNDRDVI